MKFVDFPYRRPDLTEVRQEFEAALALLKSATTDEAAIEAVNQIQDIQHNLNTQGSLAGIRFNINTKDSFYQEEMEFWDEQWPVIEGWITEYYQAVLDSNHRQAIEDHLPGTFFGTIKNALAVHEPDLVPLLQQENRLTTEYSQLIASAEIEYKGEIYNLSGLNAYFESTDQDERVKTQELVTAFFQDNQDEFDRIYDDLVKVRHQMSVQLGYDNYIGMGYARMNRLDYGQDEVEAYRAAIREHIVPFAQRLIEAQGDRLGLDHLYYYDLPLDFKNGNPKPQGNADELVAKAAKMYQELSPETAEFFNFMMEHELLDLETKPGKNGGGFCDYLPFFKSPFIFANFNGTSGDVDVLTHEAGHAFQIYSSRHVTTPECIWPTYESCEIHSMSMEFFAWPWMEEFFPGESDKYHYSHLIGTFLFLPYGALVDHFQHEVYLHPEYSPQERRACWRELEKQYLPWKDYKDNAFLEVGGFWFRQGHIFSSPFYYIDYTLAQVCALQFWRRSILLDDDSAWSDYLAISRVGGTISFLQMVALGNLKSPFEADLLPMLVEAAQSYLDQAQID